MKSLILVRHAKSNWDNPLQKDFDRPLNERGKRDAPLMAKRLREKSIQIDAFISSPANRALTTAGYFAEAYEVDRESIIQKPELYHAPPAVFYHVIAGVDDRYNTIILFSHNAGITEFANGLTTTRIDHMPTCSTFGIKVETDNWKAFFDAAKTFWFFDYPKNR